MKLLPYDAVVAFKAYDDDTAIDAVAAYDDETAANDNSTYDAVKAYDDVGDSPNKYDAATAC